MDLVLKICIFPVHEHVHLVAIGEKNELLLARDLKFDQVGQTTFTNERFLIGFLQKNRRISSLSGKKFSGQELVENFAKSSKFHDIFLLKPILYRKIIYISYRTQKLINIVTTLQ